MSPSSRLSRSVLVIATIVVGIAAWHAHANHSWRGYHWARTVNPFTLPVDDHMSDRWDSYLAEATSDWNVSDVLDLSVIPGDAMRPIDCQPILGRIQACSAKFGKAGWLSLGQVWLSDSEHINAALVKMNDTYFGAREFNDPALRRNRLCQEIGHVLGLENQDWTYENANLGTCLDSSNDPDGGTGGASETDPSAEHPNAHDFEELDTIYGHLDATTTVGAFSLAPALNSTDPSGWGKKVGTHGHVTIYERPLGDGSRVITYVTSTE